MIPGTDHRHAFPYELLHFFHRQKNRGHVGQCDLLRLGQAAHGRVGAVPGTLGLEQFRQGDLTKVRVLGVDDVRLCLVGGEQSLERLAAGCVRSNLREVLNDIVADVFLLEDNLVLAEGIAVASWSTALQDASRYFLRLAKRLV